MRCGFVGLVNLGARLARRLLDGGYALVVHDRERAAAAPLRAEGFGDVVDRD